MADPLLDNLNGGAAVPAQGSPATTGQGADPILANVGTAPVTVLPMARQVPGMPPAAAPAVPVKAGYVGSAPSGVFQGVNDVQNGLGQVLYNSLPAPLRNAGDAADHWLYQNTGGLIGTAPGLNFNQAVKAQNDAYEAGRQANGRTGIDAYRMGGNAIGQALVIGATGAPATGVTGGALAGLTAPVTNGVSNAADYLRQKLYDVGTGAVLSKGVDALGNTIANVVGPKLSQGVQTLTDAGVTLTPGQILGGALKRAEDGLTSVPVLGDMIRNAQRRSFQGLNTAALNRSLAPVNLQVPNGMTGRAAVNWTADRLGDAYDDVLSRIGAIRPDAQFSTDMGNLTALTQNLTPEKVTQFGNIVKNEITNRIDSNGVMTPEAMKAAESNLGGIVRGYLGSADYDTRQLGTALQQAQANLRSMVQRVAPPQYAQQLQAANTGWANFLRPQAAAASLGSDNGVFTPAQLQNSVKAFDQSRNKAAFARGNALMQDLSDSAKSVMGSTVPDSGTPYRHAMQLATSVGLGGLAAHGMGFGLPPAAMAAAPLVGMGAGFGLLPYTQLGQKAISGLLTGARPQIAYRTAGLLRNALPVVSTPAAAAGLGLLRDGQ